MLRASGVTTKGRVRPTNEDYFAIDEGLHLCVVADGLGGHNAGEVAARMAVDAVADLIALCGEGSGSRGGAVGGAALPGLRGGAEHIVPQPAGAWPFGFDASFSHAGNLLRTAIHLANVQILETAIGSDEYAGMSTTIVAALIDGERLSVGHVGDSRLYVVADGSIRQLTHDDSWVASALGDDRQAKRDHPMRNLLTNVVGARPRTDVHVVEEMLGGGELLLLVTDGVHGVLEDRRLERLARDGGDLHRIATSLVSAALARGSRDNCTAVAARYLPD